MAWPSYSQVNQSGHVGRGVTSVKGVLHSWGIHDFLQRRESGQCTAVYLPPHPMKMSSMSGGFPAFPDTEKVNIIKFLLILLIAVPTEDWARFLRKCTMVAKGERVIYVFNWIATPSSEWINQGKTECRQASHNPVKRAWAKVEVSWQGKCIKSTSSERCEVHQVPQAGPCLQIQKLST